MGSDSSGWCSERARTSIISLLMWVAIFKKHMTVSDRVKHLTVRGRDNENTKGIIPWQSPISK